MDRWFTSRGVTVARVKYAVKLTMIAVADTIVITVPGTNST